MATPESSTPATSSASAPIKLSAPVNGPTVQSVPAKMSVEQVKALVEAFGPFIQLPPNVSSSQLRGVNVLINADGTGTLRISYKAA